MLTHEVKYGVCDHTGATKSQNGKDHDILISVYIYSHICICLYFIDFSSLTCDIEIL